MFAKSEPIVVSFCPRPLRAATMEEARRAREEYVAKLKEKSAKARERVAALDTKGKSRLSLACLAVLTLANVAALPITSPEVAAVTVLALGVAALAWPVARLLDVLFDR